MKLLLHACCGPCALEPVRLLRMAGHELVPIYYNPNIHPAEEYARRLETLKAWASEEGLELLELEYDPEKWEEAIAKTGQEQVGTDTYREEATTKTYEDGRPNPELREERCRACYRLRLEAVAREAKIRGFDAIGTTLSVSPYQYTQVIREELERAACSYGLVAVFEDFRTFYAAATQRSRELGMYRQNYCGCRFSRVEAEEERRARKEARKKKAPERPGKPRNPGKAR